MKLSKRRAYQTLEKKYETSSAIDYAIPSSHQAQSTARHQIVYVKAAEIIFTSEQQYIHKSRRQCVTYHSRSPKTHHPNPPSATPLPNPHPLTAFNLKRPTILNDEIILVYSVPPGLCYACIVARCIATSSRCNKVLDLSSSSLSTVPSTTISESRDWVQCIMPV